MSLTLRVELKLFLLVSMFSWYVLKWSLFNDPVLRGGVLQRVRRLVSAIGTFRTNVHSLRK